MDRNRRLTAYLDEIFSLVTVLEMLAMNKDIFSKRRGCANIYHPEKMEKEVIRMKKGHNHVISYFVLIFLIILSFVFSSVAGEKLKKKLTVEMLFDTDIQEKLRSPRYMWLKDEKVLLFDFQKKRDVRNLEFLDPETSDQSEAMDKTKVLEALQEEVGKKAFPYIRWPQAVDPNGQALLYVLKGDIFCVEISGSTVKRLTETSDKESSATFSPDGTWISFVRKNDLYVLDWRKGAEKRLTFGATDTLLNGPLSWVYWEEIYDHASVPYCWSPDSKAIAYLQTDDSQVSLSTFVDFKPSTQGVVRQRYPKSGQVNPKVRLGIVELSSAQTTWIDCRTYEYLARFNWLPNSQEIAVQTLNRQQSELKLWMADRGTGQSRLILTDRQPAWINLNHSLYFLKDGEHFIWLSERDGYQHLYFYQKDGRLVRQLTKGNYMVYASAGAPVSRNGGLVAVDEKAGWVYFTSNKHALKERHLYRIRMDGTALERLSRETGVHVVSFSESMEFFLDTHSNSHTPPSLSLYRGSGQKIFTVAPSAKSCLEDFELFFPEFHTFKAEDGLEIPAVMFKPFNFSPGEKYPAIVYVYGGPGAQVVVDRWGSRTLWNSLLAQEGFYVFVFEVRAGMGKNKSLETSVYKEAYGMRNVKDILSGVRWLKTLSSVDSERLGIWGWSGGGCTTLYTMTHAEAFKAAIAVAPVSDWNYYDTIYTERYMSTPQDNPVGYEETSSVLTAHNLKGKLLIVHGTYDDNVHPQNTLAFINKLIEKNISFELMIYPWRKHGIRDVPASIHLYNLMLDFWKRNL